MNGSKNRRFPCKTLTAWGIASTLLISAPGFPCRATAAAGIGDVHVTGGGVAGVAKVGQIGVLGTPNLNFNMGATNANFTPNLMTAAQTPTIQIEMLPLIGVPVAVVEGPLEAPNERITVVPVKTEARDAPAFKERKIVSATGIQEVVAQIGVGGNSDNNSTGIWALLSKFWENMAPSGASAPKTDEQIHTPPTPPTSKIPTARPEVILSLDDDQRHRIRQIMEVAQPRSPGRELVYLQDSQRYYTTPFLFKTDFPGQIDQLQRLSAIPYAAGRISTSFETFQALLREAGYSCELIRAFKDRELPPDGYKTVRGTEGTY